MRIVFCVIIVSLFFSCKKAPEFDLNESFPEAIGEWQWKYTYFPFENIDNVDSLSSEYRMIVEPNGHIRIIQNDLIIEKWFLESYIDNRNESEGGVVSRVYKFEIDNTNVNIDANSKIFFRFYFFENTNCLGIDSYPFNVERPPNLSAISSRNVYEKIK